MDRRGFTLIELVLSTALVALVLLVALTSLSFGTRLLASGYTVAEQGWIKRYFTTGFQTDISSAFPYRDKDGVIFRGTPGTLTFVSAGSATGLPWGGARLVTYALEDRQFVMKESVLPLSEEKPVSTETELSREVDDIRFSYLGSSGWEDEWDGIEKDALPLAVKAEVLLRGDTRPEEFSIPVMMRSKRDTKE